MNEIVKTEMEIEAIEQQKMLQAWWEKTGVNLSHKAACDEAFRLGMVVGGGDCIDAYGRTVDDEGLPLNLVIPEQKTQGAVWNLEYIGKVKKKLDSMSDDDLDRALASGVASGKLRIPASFTQDEIKELLEKPLP